VDPACLQVILMAACMATTTLPHVIEGLCGAGPRSADFVEHFADQVAIVARLLNLGDPVDRR
jgi:TetR/AcrR family transcriptional regulator